MDKNSKLYKKIKKMADEKFSQKTSLYKSFWIVNKYRKQRGGAPQFDGHYSQTDILVTVPERVRQQAKYFFKLQKLGFKGTLDTGKKRAKQLATKPKISIKDVQYIRSFFARHIYSSLPTFKKWLKAGRPKNDPYWHNKHSIQAILSWGGLAAIKWVNSLKILNLLNKTFNKQYKPLKYK